MEWTSTNGPNSLNFPGFNDRSPYAKCGACGAAVRMKATKFSDGFLVLEYHTLEGRHQDAGIGYAGERCPAAFKRARKATKAEKAAWKAQAEAAKKAEQEAYNALVQASYETRRVMQDERARGA